MEIRKKNTNMIFTKFTVFFLASIAMLCFARSSAAPSAARKLFQRSAIEGGANAHDSHDAEEGGIITSSGDYACNSTLTEDEMRDEIVAALQTLSVATQKVHVWTASGPRAVVGIYGDRRHTLITNVTEYNYGHYIASSVAYFYSFIRPVGDVLTNETVREVIDLEPGFATDLAAVRETLIVVASNIYQLVKGVWTIHECIIPNLPVDSHTVLSPQPPLGIVNATEREVIVDGIANELQTLALDTLEVINGYYYQSRQ